MFTQRSSTAVSRRTALAGLGAGSLGLALAAPARHAQADQTSLVDHPLTGAWLLTLPGAVAPAVFTADGTVTLAWQACGAGSAGAVEFTTSGVGTWKSTGARGGYVNVLQVLADEMGAFMGTRSLHCYLVVSDDGRSFLDDGIQTRVYVRNAAHTVTAILGEDGDSAPMSGVRMSPGSPGFSGHTGSPAEQ
jgi:hypothetical protein